MFEINKIFNQLIVLIFEIIIASLFVIIDILFQEALITVKNHADIEYTQTGSHNFTLEVKYLICISKPLIYLRNTIFLGKGNWYGGKIGKINDVQFQHNGNG